MPNIMVLINALFKKILYIQYIYIYMCVCVCVYICIYIYIYMYIYTVYIYIYIYTHITVYILLLTVYVKFNHIWPCCMCAERHKFKFNGLVKCSLEMIDIREHLHSRSLN